jgi:hypothetical protein
VTGLEADHRFQPPTYGYTVYASAFKRSVPGRVPTRFRLKLTRSSRKAVCFQCRSRQGNAQICLPTANSGLIESAKLNGVDPQAWLADVLARIADHPAKRIGDLLPWNWRAAMGASAVAAA